MNKTDELIDFKGIPLKSEKELFAQYPPDLMLVMDQVLASRKTFQMIFQDFIDMMKYGYERDEVRHRIIFFKFHKEDNEIKSMQLNHVIANLIFWQTLIDIDSVDALDESWIFDFTKFNSKTLMEYINTKILPIYDTDYATKNAMVDELYNYIISISHAFCLLMGMGISLYDLHQLEMRDPTVSHIMRDPIDPTLEPHEVEQILNDRNKELIDHLVKDPLGNDYKPFFASGTGLKEAQFREYLVGIGFKSDINGNTIPILIDDNFLLNGLTKPSHVYINATSGRKALILTKLSMGQPGAFSKKLSFSSISSVLRSDFEMCDSIETIDYHIINDEFLRLLNGRYYYDSRGNLQYIDYEKDKDKIGKVLRFKSPITCNSKEGVCKYCYGHMFEINQSMFSAGTLASLKITEPVGQGILSSKHSQSTSSNELQFSEGYDDVFETTSSVISIKDESNFDANLFIKLGPVSIEEFDDSETYYVDNFDLVDENGELIRHIEEASGARFYLNDHLLQMYKAKIRSRSGDPLFSLEDLDDAESLFTIEVKNKELTEPLKILTKILNSKDHYGARTISELCQVFAEKLVQMNIKYEFVHAEMILRSLIRKKTDILQYPDFSAGGNLNNYQILKLDDALFHNPSVIVGMSYGYLRRALMSPELYQKTSTGPLDSLAVSQLSQYL